MNEGQLDFSVQEMPQTWIDASADAPPGESRPLKKQTRNLGTLGRARMDPFGAVVGSVGPAVVAGASWYYVDNAGAFDSPWTPIFYGAIIGIGVRLGGGRPEPSQRASIAVSIYVLATAIVLFLIHRANVSAYLPSYDWGDIERSVVRGYLLDANNAVGLLGGIIAATAINLSTRLRG
jgi:hypothetical protein